jgi:hypothetical protein
MVALGKLDQRRNQQRLLLHLTQHGYSLICRNTKPVIVHDRAFLFQADLPVETRGCTGH